MHLNKTWSTSLSERAVWSKDSPGYVAFSEEPEVLKTQPGEQENAKILWVKGKGLLLLMCFVSSEHRINKVHVIKLQSHKQETVN